MADRDKTPEEVRKILLGIDGPETDIEVRAISAGILKPNWRSIAADKKDTDG